MMNHNVKTESQCDKKDNLYKLNDAPDLQSKAC